MSAENKRPPHDYANCPDRDCWACRIFAPDLAALKRHLHNTPVPATYQCTFVDCDDIATQGHLCAMHEKKGSR